MVVHQTDEIQGYIKFLLLQLWLMFVDMNLGFDVSLFQSLFFLYKKKITSV